MPPCTQLAVTPSCQNACPELAYPIGFVQVFLPEKLAILSIPVLRIKLIIFAVLCFISGDKIKFHEKAKLYD